jgi:uncharacterized membrane protein
VGQIHIDLLVANIELDPLHGPRRLQSKQSAPEICVLHAVHRRAGASPTPSGYPPETRKNPDYFQKPQFQAALFAYILTFFVIGLWWQAHHLIFGYIRQYDRVLVRANSVFLVTIAILPFATVVLNAANRNPVGVGFFAVTQIAAGLSLAGVWWYASGPGRLVHEGVPVEWRTYLSRITLVTPVVFALSIPVAFWPVSVLNLNPGELVWLGAFVVPIAFRHRAKAAGH